MTRTHKDLYVPCVMCDEMTIIQSNPADIVPTGGQCLPGIPTGSSHKRLVYAVQ